MRCFKDPKKEMYVQSDAVNMLIVAEDLMIEARGVLGIHVH